MVKLITELADDEVMEVTVAELRETYNTGFVAGMMHMGATPNGKEETNND